MYEVLYYIHLLDIKVRIGIYSNLTDAGKAIKQTRKVAGCILRHRHKLCKLIEINEINIICAVII